MHMAKDEVEDQGLRNKWVRNEGSLGIFGARTGCPPHHRGGLCVHLPDEPAACFLHSIMLPSPIPMSLLRYTLLVLGILALRASAQTVACGAYHGLVLCTDGNVMAWGENTNGNVGTGTFESPVLSPVVVQTAAVGEVVQLAAGLSTSYAVNDAGEVWAWGVGNYGQLGNGGTTAEPLPVQVAPLSGTVVQVSAGNHFAIALKNDGTLWSWGYNQFGMLGDNTLTQRLAPVAVSNTYGGGIAAISSGAQHTLALKNDSSVWAWGRSEYGQVGIGGWTTLDEPTPCNGMGDSVVAIAAGSFHSLALKSDGTVWAWGRNSAGQLGVGSYWDTSTPTPLQVIGLSDVVRIAAVGSTSFAMKADGSVWSWGLNNDGLLTMDTGEAFNPTPLQVTALGEFPLIYNGGVGFHALAIAANGDLLSWGYRLYGCLLYTSPSPRD